MKDEENLEIRETIQSNESENLLRDTNLKNIEKIVEKEEENQTENKDIKKNNSLSTIFSIANSIVGTSIMTLPYNVYKTGIIPAIIITIIYDLISFYTCKIYVDYGTKDNDFSLTIEKYFKKFFGQKMSKIGKTIQIFFCTFMGTGSAYKSIC